MFFYNIIISEAEFSIVVLFFFLEVQPLIAPAICISSSLFMKAECTCHDPGSAREVCHPVIHAWSRPAEMADASTTGWICSVGIDGNPFVDCSIDRRLFVRTTPIILMLLVQQEQKKKTNLDNSEGFRDSVL